MGSFHFLSLKSYFLKYKKFFRVAVSWNIRKFCFLKHKKSFLLRKYNKFFRGFYFLKYKKSFPHEKFPWGGFFNFFELRLKSAGFHFQKSKKNFLLRKYKKFFRAGFFRKKYKKSFKETLWGLRLENALSRCKVYCWQFQDHLKRWFVCQGQTVPFLHQ